MSGLAVRFFHIVGIAPSLNVARNATDDRPHPAQQSSVLKIGTAFCREVLDAFWERRSRSVRLALELLASTLGELPYDSVTLALPVTARGNVS